jgi:hypothetical protein
MLYVILVNTCRVDQLIFTMQCELSKLQINIVKIFHFYVKKQQKPVHFVVNRRFFAGKPVRIQINLNWSNRSVFTGFYRFTVGKPLPVGSGFSIQNGFVNRALYYQLSAELTAYASSLFSYTVRTYTHTPLPLTRRIRIVPDVAFVFLILRKTGR